MSVKTKSLDQQAERLVIWRPARARRRTARKSTWIPIPARGQRRARQYVRAPAAPILITGTVVPVLALSAECISTSGIMSVKPKKAQARSRFRTEPRMPAMLVFASCSSIRRSTSR